MAVSQKSRIFALEHKTKGMILQNIAIRYIAIRLVCNGRTPVRSGAYSSSLKGVLRTILLLLTLTLGAGSAWGQTNITALSQITDADGHYVITQNISGGTPGVTTFNGILEANINPNTHMPYKITGLSAPLFTTLTGTVKNLVLESVSITSGDEDGNTGAIACTANGSARIYNIGILSGSVGGTAYTGGLVGLLDDEARVVNCYSYADITGGSDVGGIVGHNNVATASNNLKTMVFACMFYGDITGGSSIAPIYNGTNIVNKDANGVSNFNYFRLEAPYVQPTGVTYNCALGAEDRFLQRFEFFRHLLNSHRELAGWWATGTYSSSEILKWVLEPSQLDSDTPYPILKEFGKYPSVVNLDKDNLEVFSNDEETKKSQRNQGRKFGTLAVTIQMDNSTDNTVPYHHPGTGVNEASITTSSLSLPITDKDPDHYNFNYYKVQLPYYNDVGTKNYNGNRVVTGWKIVSITGGTSGSYTTGDDVTYNASGEIETMPYNFADRKCTNKDLYSTSKRVFNQGAYWDVPEGVTAITIEPYWARCTYLADQNADKVYNTAMNSPTDVPNVGGGQIYTNNTNYNIAGENQKVYTGSDAARNNLGLDASHTVYDHAIVLVGNFHKHNGVTSGTTTHLYTIMSIDADHDNEPDYSYILRFDSRVQTHSVRVDFINIPGLGMAQKSTGGTGSYNFGIMQPKGWFESTNTSLFRVTQFEYDRSDRVAAPYIVQGGVIEQWVCGQNNGAANNITYFHVGGNVWFKEFHRGTHQDKSLQSKHPPVSVTGGDYDEFYLTGLYTANVTSYGDNAECYINGGRFGIVAGAAMEGIGNSGGSDDTGNITWQVQNADINEFYAGGINAAKPVQGSLTTVVEGGYIKLFCGGPKFGDMSSGKTVTTTATGCTFDTFFGAGYGGNSYSRQAPRNHNNVVNFPHKDTQNPSAGNHSSWNDWLDDYYTQEYNSTYGGVSTQFSYQFLPMSGNADNVARIFVEYVKFSLATTHSVTSTLTGCTINNNFYGGGSLGKVNGTVTSTLNNCTVKGNVFGAGYSANLRKVKVDYIGFKTEPFYYTELGTYRKGVKYDENDDDEHKPKEYTWEYRATVNSTATAINKTSKILYTSVDIRPEKHNLGSVEGAVNLTLTGNTKVGTLEGGEGSQTLKTGTGNVYGGGEQSYVIKGTSGTGNVTVKLQGDTQVYGNVFGGGDEGKVEGSTEVNIE